MKTFTTIILAAIICLICAGCVTKPTFKPTTESETNYDIIYEEDK
jgi:hypothetical protein